MPSYFSHLKAGPFDLLSLSYPISSRRRGEGFELTSLHPRVVVMAIFKLQFVFNSRHMNTTTFGAVSIECWETKEKVNKTWQRRYTQSRLQPEWLLQKGKKVKTKDEVKLKSWRRRRQRQRHCSWRLCRHKKQRQSVDKNVVKLASKKKRFKTLRCGSLLSSEKVQAKKWQICGMKIGPFQILKLLLNSFLRYTKLTNLISEFHWHFVHKRYTL